MLRVLRKNQKSLMAFISSLKHDSIFESIDTVKVEIKNALEVIEQKLSGRISLGQDGMCGITHTVEEQFKQLILNASSDESLKRMYAGWMPWL